MWKILGCDDESSVVLYVVCPFIILHCEDLGFWCSFCWNIILKVKELLQNLGIGDHTAVVQDDDADDEAVPLHHDGIC